MIHPSLRPAQSTCSALTRRLLQWFPGNSNVHEGLVVRVQDNDKFPWWGCTGAVAVVPVNFSGSTARAGKVTAQSVVWPGVTAPPKLPPSICPPGKANCHAKLWGAIDPRIAYRPATRTYFLGWDNCSQGCSYRQTQLSTTKNPYDPSSWKHHGPHRQVEAT